MGKYLRKKLIIYLITFFFAVTLDWAIPRFMPGDPISMLLARFNGLENSSDIVRSTFTKSFGLDQPLITQYFGFWKSLFTGDLGISIYLYPKKVSEIISQALIYDILLLLPAILLSWIVGNKLGARSGVNKKVDNIMMPFFYVLTSSPYFWFAVLLVFFFGVKLQIFPVNGAYSNIMIPGFNIQFILDFLYHWVLPFLSLFMVMLGGWAIGMRNMIIYEMGSNYSKYMESLGSSEKLIRKYAFRNAILPQVTGLALQLGTIVAGAFTTEIVFSYPGIGYILLKALLNQDYFLIQGCFLFIVICVLVANFLVDIVYMLIDPRVRFSFSGEV
ncbi:MAG: ABC transporter permease [Thermotogae bacterium]|nr:ABC transporter permease [Thermotogota bacterium]MCP5465761.1 ABC transporter permease [Thermotogota bacterium]HOO73756.1 ABC transporter permease [Tepiditoga sp.]